MPNVTLDQCNAIATLIDQLIVARLRWFTARDVPQRATEVAESVHQLRDGLFAVLSNPNTQAPIATIPTELPTGATEDLLTQLNRAQQAAVEPSLAEELTAQRLAAVPAEMATIRRQTLGAGTTIQSLAEENHASVQENLARKLARQTHDPFTGNPLPGPYVDEVEPPNNS